MAAAVMDVSDTKEWLHLADASEWGGLEVMNREVESKQEGGKEQQRGSKYLHLHLTFQAFSCWRAEEPGKKGEFEKGMI